MEPYMSSASIVQITIAFVDPTLDAKERDIEAQQLMEELAALNEVESVSRVIDPNSPEGSKGLGGLLIGLLTAEIDGNCAGEMLGFLQKRLERKPIELTVEANGKKLSVKAHSTKDLTAAIQSAKDFISC